MRNSIYTALKSYYVDFNTYFQKELVCFNDTKNLIDSKYQEVKESLIYTFLEHYPDKCQFEKEDRFYILTGELEHDLDLDENYNNIVLSLVEQPNLSHDILKVKGKDNLDYTRIKYVL